MLKSLTNEFCDSQEFMRLPALLPEIRFMLKVIQCIGWMNLLIGMPSVLLMLTMNSWSLVFTGMLSIFTFRLLSMMVQHVNRTKNWAEVGVIIMCGVYLPGCIMWLCANNLLEAILSS